MLEHHHFMVCWCEIFSKFKRMLTRLVVQKWHDKWDTQGKALSNFGLWALAYFHWNENDSKVELIDFIFSNTTGFVYGIPWINDQILSIYWRKFHQTFTFIVILHLYIVLFLCLLATVHVHVNIYIYMYILYNILNAYQEMSLFV